VPHPSSAPSPDGARPGIAPAGAAPPDGARIDGVRPGPGPIDGIRPGLIDGAGIDRLATPIGAAELESVRQELAGLRAALVSRATIDQARGILIARYRISPDGAFELLVRWSQDRNIKLRTIAETLVALAQFGPEGPGTDPSLGRWLAEQLVEPPASP
jgi:hypothetical protein